MKNVNKNAEQKNGIRKKKLPQHRTTPTITLIQNYFGKLDTIQYPHTNRDTTLLSHDTLACIYFH